MAQRTILVVEDTPDLLTMLQHLLEAADYRVITATTGASALKALRGVTPIDVLISDLRLPDIDGEELGTLAGQVLPGLKVLLMSGTGSPRKSLPMITKPFSGRALLQQLRSI